MDEVAYLKRKMLEYRLCCFVGFPLLAVVGTVIIGLVLSATAKVMRDSEARAERQRELISSAMDRADRWQAAAELWMLRTPDGRAELERMRREQLDAPRNISSRPR